MPDAAPRFGRYVVLDQLSGESGERTLVAYDPELDRKVGLKVFPVASEAEQTRRRDRARVLAGLVHPHVVRVHDVGAVEGQLFAAMDFVEGQTVQPWIEHERPPWPRVLEVLLAAGEGLAAAHAAGLVHGRFSGDAVVVGDDGQVRVIDFVRSSPQLGAPPTEADDRRALCAAIHHALWGRPPGGDEPDEPLDAPGKGKPATEPKLPRRVRRAVLEGLREPSRWRSVRALVDELRAATRRRRRAGAAAVLLTIAAGSAWALLRPGPAPAVSPWCEGIDARLAAVWSPEALERSQAAFVATGAPYAEDAWIKVDAELRRFVDEWTEAQAEHCAATPDEAATLRRAAATVCLHRQFQALRALMGELQSADLERVASAARTVSSLGSPAACGSTMREDPFYSEVDLEHVLAVETELSRGAVLRELGRYHEAVAVLEPARARARALGLRALVGEADYGLAVTRANVGEEERAERGYHRAFDAAVATGHHEIVARSAMELAVLLAEQGRDDEARRWAGHAAAAVERHDTLPLRTRLTAVRGAVAYRHGDHEEAKRHYEQSIALAEQADPPDGFAKMHATQALANVMGRLGATQDEIELLEQGLRFVEAELGPRHPAVAHHLNSLATALARRGSIDLALGSHARTVEIFEEAFGPDHPHTIAGRTSQAATLHEAGRDEEAERAYDAALASAKRSLGPADSRTVTVIGNVGMFYALTDRHVEAAALLSEAATRNEALHGPDHVHTLGYLNNLAATYMFSGNLDEARKVYVMIAERTERVLGSDHPQLVPALLGLARVEHELGDPAAAVPRLERALRISLDRKERPERVAVVRFDLARALWDAALDRARALGLAREAVQSYVEARNGGWDIGDHVERIQVWIAERSPEQAP